MLTIPTNTRISFCTSPVDMRKSFNGLIGIVRNELNADPLAGHLFVFLNKYGVRGRHTLSPCAAPRTMMAGKVNVQLTFLEGRKHLPILQILRV
jgi:transposase